MNLGETPVYRDFFNFLDSQWGLTSDSRRIPFDALSITSEIPGYTCTPALPVYVLLNFLQQQAYAFDEYLQKLGYTIA